MTIKEIIKLTLAMLSMAIELFVLCLGVIQGPPPVYIWVIGSLAIIWLIEAISCFHIVSYGWEEKRYYIESRSGKGDLCGVGFAVFGVSIFCAAMYLSCCSI